MKFRKKPVVVDAWQWKPEGQEDVPFPDWLNDALIEKRVFLDGLCLVFEGEVYSQFQIARAGDWIIKGLLGDVYPCRDDIFRKLYEEV